MICDHTLPKCLFEAANVCCLFINNKRPSKPLPNQSRYQNADMNLFVTVLRPEWDAPPVSPIHNPIFSGPFWKSLSCKSVESRLYNDTYWNSVISRKLSAVKLFQIALKLSSLPWNFSRSATCCEMTDHHYYLIKTLSYFLLSSSSRSFNITTKCWVHYLWINMRILFWASRTIFLSFYL